MNSLSLLALTGGWVGARLIEASNRRLSPPERRLAVATVSGLATAAEGIRFSRTAPGGAVPLRDG